MTSPPVTDANLVYVNHLMAELRLSATPCRLIRIRTSKHPPKQRRPRRALVRLSTSAYCGGCSYPLPAAAE
jgi:hypothetical protein